MMTAGQLKLSILRLAMQGKLVEQKSEDGTADELFDSIKKAEKELVKEGVIKKPSTKSKVSDDETPYELPENWKWVKLDSLCSIVTGKKDANFGAVDGKYLFFTCAKEPIRCNSYSFSGESILLAGNGDINNISYYWGEFEAYQRTYVLQPFIENTYLKYLYYHIQSNWLEYNTGKVYGTAIPYIRMGNVQRYLVALPPLAEQKRIVAKIEELMPFVEQYAEASTKLNTLNTTFPEMMKKSILQEAVQGKLVPQDSDDEPASELVKRIAAEKHRLIKKGEIKKQKALPEITEEEIPFEIPETWAWERIGNIFKIGTGMTPLKSNSLFYDGGTIPWITSSQTSERYISKAESYITEYALENTTLTVYPAHSLIIAMYGQGKTRGQISELLINATTNQACAILEHYIYYPELIEYTYYFFKYNYDVLRKKAEGTSQPNLNLNKIAETLIPIPPLGEQRRIVEELEKHLKELEHLNWLTKAQ